MSIFDWGQIALFVTVLIASSFVLGTYMTSVFIDTVHQGPLHFGWAERLVYRFANVNGQEEMSALRYIKNLLLFNSVGCLVLVLLLLLQGILPLNPQGFRAPSLDQIFNISLSFVTNTNWQSYAGEDTLSYLSQMSGLGVQNFLSAATGMSVLLVVIRGFVRKNAQTVGNFWVDLTRSTLYLFIPLSFVFAMILVEQGVVQTLSPYAIVHALEEGESANSPLAIPLGPVASQVAIKQLGTNGGGFFGANGAHPFENPTPLSNFLQTLGLILIPAASLHMYGAMIGSKRQGWLLFFAMFALWAIGFAIASLAEHQPNPIFQTSQVLEGQEIRFGIGNSLLWSTSTTATSNGAVNSMLSSLSPLAGGVALFNITIGELIFGGVGAGLVSMIMYVLLTVFLCGLMVGRTPEYLGKKIEKKEMQWVMAAILIAPALTLIGSAFSTMLPQALVSLKHEGPHGLSEILYAFASSAGNNGSAFAGLNANTPYFNVVLGFVMLVGRLAFIIPSIALAGLLAKKNTAPPSIGAFSTNTGLFFILLIVVIVIVEGLSFFPALSLGPIVEQLLMSKGQSF